MLFFLLRTFLVVRCSSGTSKGRPKFIPFNDSLFETTMQIFQTSFAFRNK